MRANDSTHFGYQEIPAQEKAGKVANIFHTVAEQYDVMNDLMSLGIHRLWKRFAIDLCTIRPGQQVLDLAGGTGDLAIALTEKVGPTGCVCLADINSSMLNIGRDRLIDAGRVGNVVYAQVNAESLPFLDNSFDCITMAFGLRNVTDQNLALQSMWRVLKPGGKVIILEFSKPIVPLLDLIYEQYSFKLIPWIGEWITGDKASYQYLVESIRRHPQQAVLKQMMNDANFEDVDYFNLTGGIVALHRGYKY